MIRRPPRSTRTDTLFPYTTLFRSGRLKAIRKPMPTYAGTKNLNFRAPLELKTAEGHLWRGIDPRQRRPKKDDPTSYMDCRTYHIPGTLSGQAIYDEADTKRSDEHTSELQSLMRSSYAVVCLQQ